MYSTRQAFCIQAVSFLQQPHSSLRPAGKHSCGKPRQKGVNINDAWKPPGAFNTLFTVSAVTRDWSQTACRPYRDTGVNRHTVSVTASKMTVFRCPQWLLAPKPIPDRPAHTHLPVKVWLQDLLGSCEVPIRVEDEEDWCGVNASLHHALLLAPSTLVVSVHLEQVVEQGKGGHSGDSLVPGHSKLLQGQVSQVLQRNHTA